MDLVQTVSDILERVVTEDEAKDFALNQFGVLSSYIKKGVKVYVVDTDSLDKHWTELSDEEFKSIAEDVDRDFYIDDFVINFNLNWVDSEVDVIKVF